MKRWGFLVVKIVLSGALLAWILSRPEVGSLVPLLREADWAWIGAGVGCGGVAIWGMAWRWQACLEAMGLHLGLGELFRISLAASATGYFSIGQLGADAAKVLLAGRRLGGRHAALAASLSLDHASSLPVMGGLFLLAIVPHGLVPTVREHGLWALLGGAVCFVLGGLLVRWKWRSLHDRILSVLSKPRLWRGFGIAALRALPLWVAYAGVYYCAARAFAVQVPFVGFAGVAAIADAIASLPISVAGLGVREQTFQTLLQHWHGVAPSGAVALSLTGFGIFLSWALVGAAGMFAAPVPPSTT